MANEATPTLPPQKLPAPELTQARAFSLIGARHPLLKDAAVPVDVACGVEGSGRRFNTLVITGPNMGGKSTYMRQCALIALLARIGSFVPADDAEIGDIDRIFTRIGASDELSRGRSTFMVEMEEAAAIVHNATARSLVLMDEIGRGTSTVEGEAIATAVAVYLCKNLHSLTLFSTHFPRIATLSDSFTEISDICFRAGDSGGRIVFFYEACPGRQNYSYAIEVGRLAGLPEELLQDARRLKIGRAHV